jgi:hypothetical protein
MFEGGSVQIASWTQPVNGRSWPLGAHRKTADDEAVRSRASARSRQSDFAASGKTKVIAPNVRQKDVLGITRSGSSFGSRIRLKGGALAKQ